MDEARRLAFGSVAELYDSSRPSYPLALVDDVLSFCGAASPRMLEVGAGTGKATVLFAERAASMVALEPDSAMAAVAVRNCPGAEIEQSEFERWRPGDRHFDLLISAQAWHWVKPELRTSLARDALVDGGALAVFWNWPVWDECAIAAEIRAAYAAVPGFTPQQGPMHPAGTKAVLRWREYGDELTRAAGFSAAEAREYKWNQAYTAPEYTQLIGTHSDHIVLEPEARRQLIEAVGAAIDAAGGSFMLSYVTFLWLARAS